MTDLIDRLRKLSPSEAMSDEAADEIDRQRVQYKMLMDDRDMAQKLLSDTTMALGRVEVERDALREDAARYRWLRSQPLDEPEIWIAVDSASVPGRWALGGDDPGGCDAAIDAARAALKGVEL